MATHPLSKEKVATGRDTEAMADGKDSLIYRLNTGGGFSKRSPWGGILHAFAEMDLNAGKRFRGKVAAGPGLSLGALDQVSHWWKIQLRGEAYFYFLGDDRVSLKATLAQNFRLAQKSSLSMEYSYTNVQGHSVPEAAALWNHYF